MTVRHTKNANEVLSEHVLGVMISLNYDITAGAIALKLLDFYNYKKGLPTGRVAFALKRLESCGLVTREYMDRGRVVWHCEV